MFLRPWAFPPMARRREMIDTGTDKRYIRCSKLGTSLVESDDVGLSLAADQRKRPKTKLNSGEGRQRRATRRSRQRKAARKQLASGAQFGSLPGTR